MDHPPAPSLSVCPRHPDREAYVLCQRCHRPACPQCQVQAPVGVQCVDCVREAAAQAPVNRTRAGAVARSGPPVVTYGFIGLCVLAFLLQLSRPGFTLQYGFAPVLAHAEPWRYLTAAFLHDASSAFSLHLLMNMYCLWALGQGVEPTLGRLRYLVVLVLTALGGTVGYQLFVGSQDLHLMVGASTVVFGLFGVLLTAGSRYGFNIRGVVAVVLVNAVLGFALPGIAWQGHLGGFVVGLLLGWIFTAGDARNRTAIQVGGCAAVAVALLALAAFS